MKERNIVKLIKEIASDCNINIYLYSDDWVIELEKNNKRTFVHGYTFECNSPSVNLILKDKNALYEILNRNGIDAVQHFYFYKDIDLNNGSISRMDKYLKNYNKLVIKDNVGTGGNDVYLVNDKKSMYNVAKDLYTRCGEFSISPYYEIEHEYRAIVQNGVIKVLYEKIRPFVIGDGKSSVVELKNFKYGENFKIKAKLNENYVPLNNEYVLLNWKHNLGQGATPKIVSNTQIIIAIENIVNKVVNLLKIELASIDIISVNNEYKILEINGGIMMEKFAESNKENYEIAKLIYKNAIISHLS